jgi:FdhD protein
MSEGTAEALHPALQETARRVWRQPGAAPLPGPRRLAEEVPVAFVYEGASYAVMMATPADLGDFGLGFSLNERVVCSPEEIESLDIVHGDDGIMLRITLAACVADAFWKRRRYLAGPSGCGLCGVESLAEAVRPPVPVRGGFRVAAATIAAAMASLPERQPMNRITGAMHAAAFWTLGNGIVAVREDVGRHNALDKLTGAVRAAGWNAGAGAVLLTSRVSVEMVQKAASLGAPILAAVSAPTALARRAADAAGITLIAVARHDGFEIFTHPTRIG